MEERGERRKQSSLRVWCWGGGRGGAAGRSTGVLEHLRGKSSRNRKCHREMESGILPVDTICVCLGLFSNLTREEACDVRELAQDKTFVAGPPVDPWRVQALNNRKGSKKKAPIYGGTSLISKSVLMGGWGLGDLG